MRRNSARRPLGMIILCLVLTTVLWLAFVPGRPVQAQQGPVLASGRWLCIGSPIDAGTLVTSLYLNVNGRNVSGRAIQSWNGTDFQVIVSCSVSGSVTPEGVCTLTCSNYGPATINNGQGLQFFAKSGVLNFAIGGSPNDPASKDPKTGVGTVVLNFTMDSTNKLFTLRANTNLTFLGESNRLWDQTTQPNGGFSPSEVYRLELGQTPLEIQLTGADPSGIIGTWQCGADGTSIEDLRLAKGRVSAVNLSNGDYSVLTLHDETGNLELATVVFERFRTGTQNSTADWRVLNPASGIRVFGPGGVRLGFFPQGKVTLVRP